MSVTKARPHQINIRVSPVEFRQLVAKASDVGLSVTAFVRMAALDRHIPRRDLDTKATIAALSRVGGLLNQLAAKANSGWAIDSDALSDALADVKATIRRIG